MLRPYQFKDQEKLIELGKRKELLILPSAASDEICFKNVIPNFLQCFYRK